MSFSIQTTVNLVLPTHVCECVCLSQLCPLKRPRNNDISETPQKKEHTLILVSKSHSLLRGIKLLGEMADSKAEQKRKYKVTLEHLMPKSKEVSKNDGDILKRHRNQLKRVLINQN